MSVVLPIPRHKLSVEDYHRMGEAGIFAPDARVELIEGEVIDMAPIGSLHASVVSFLSMFFSRNAGEAVFVFSQNPIRLLPNSEPQPDIAILKPRADYYRKALPSATDVLLVVEVADTSANFDRQIKMPLYAHYGIREAWLIDLKAERLEVYSDPAGGSYRNTRQLGKQDSVTPGLIQVPALLLAEIWPPA